MIEPRTYRSFKIRYSRASQPYHFCEMTSNTKTPEEAKEKLKQRYPEIKIESVTEVTERRLE